ncbi:Bug family tripartite tricarboxylate transporter substrate binding protein [Bordetella bronchialis]|uniref:BugT protein n=1 Tax=Bordetella bronchialis TaxID=463025 RepID=A0A193FMD5_9BORD|nr:tripartite tricarboxylate transporter substrate binding protein [Bordetella bronchialis]ANN68825.1 bugT protein [Bordetella bronchialis]ANN73968.1 bugT protein [Bordetella bronchialis]
MNKLHGWLAAVLLAACGMAHAEYPDHPIKMIVPWPPGGGVDTMGRLVAQGLSQELGQPVIVDNRAGAGGNIGTELAARQPADGYNLLMGSISPNAINVYLYSHLGFDPVKDFTPITYVSAVPNILVVPASSPFKTMKELVDYAKANPGKLNYGSAGVGSSQHLAAVQFMAATKINIVHVPYKGTSPAEADLMAGHVSLMLDTTTCLPLVKSGKLRALAVASRQRNAQLPDVPTLDELGVPNVYASSWYGLMGPKGMPKDVVEKLNKATNAVLKNPEIRQRMLDYGAEIGGGTPQEYATFIDEEIKRYKPIVELSGAKLD